MTKETNQKESCVYNSSFRSHCAVDFLFIITDPRMNNHAPFSLCMNNNQMNLAMVDGEAIFSYLTCAFSFDERYRLAGMDCNFSNCLSIDRC